MDARRSICEIRRLAYQHHVVSPALGQSGGIWVLRDAGLIVARDVLVSPRFIYLLLQHYPAVTPTEFTVVYMLPQPTKQTPVWNFLQHIHTSVQHLWILLGNFNAILGQHEKKGASFPTHACTSS